MFDPWQNIEDTSTDYKYTWKNDDEWTNLDKSFTAYPKPKEITEFTIMDIKLSFPKYFYVLTKEVGVIAVDIEE